MTYNDNVICSPRPLLWWSVWSGFTIRVLVPLYLPGTLLYAAREALLSSYQQEEMCTFRLSKGKSFRKWELSYHRVTISITKMTHLHNCQFVMHFIQWAFFTGELPMDSNLQLRILFLLPQLQCTVKCKEPSMPNIPRPWSFYECFFSCQVQFLPPQHQLQNYQKLFLYIFSKNQRTPERGLKDIF